MAVALDTNVVSELAKADCAPQVLTWASGFRSADFVLPAPCWAELQRGLNMLPRGRRRDGIANALERLVSGLGGVLPFEREAAEIYGSLMSESGRPRPTIDAMIASICLAQGVPLATRNTKDFEGCGLDLINPWGREAAR